MTTLILLRHAATPANLAHPARLQGRRSDPDLAPAGVAQAEAAREALRGTRIDDCVTSPLLRALRTARIVAEPHGLAVEPLDALTECDVGRWEGLTWAEAEAAEPDAFVAHHAAGSGYPYPGGESFADVAARAVAALDGLLDAREGQTLLAVSHHVVCRVYLAECLGLGAARARGFSLDNAGISVVERSGGRSRVRTLNSALHLP